MKKVLRFVGILILIIVAAVVILGLIAPKEITVERSIAINGSKDIVSEQMMKYNNYQYWNPWADMDSNMKWDVTGEDGAPGARYHWTGPEVGEGEMVTKEARPDGMSYSLHFVEPFESDAEGTYRVEDMGNGQTKAIQTFTQKENFPMNGLMMAMNMRGMLEQSFDKGLAKLKKHVESGAAGAFAIKEVQFPANTYATIRKDIGWDEMNKFFGESWGVLGKEAGQRITGAPAGIFYTWNEQNHRTDAAAAFPISGSEPVNSAILTTVPDSRAYMVEYKGGQTGMIRAHEAIGKRMAANGKKQSYVIEEYIVGPEQEADSNKWRTNIYYILQ
ncbi:SRPBCC family protein [Polluticoccus soli]|uniref:SRPBCC family protein n=1 Tax=Polluticoccus soli TaxID=3034150 RepID=UPI0023E30876|nr:SRPBCC family protein [Flavipsychrobacter sp. JY13-12]